DVYLDERYIGRVEHSDQFISNVKATRREGKLPQTLNIAFKPRLNEIHMIMSKGRARRPLIIADQGKSKLTEDLIQRLEKGDIGWEYLLSNGIIEYLDAAEEEQALIALYDEDLTSEHTHMEISPLVIVGLTTSLVPYANYGQSSRLNRGSKTQKQALGFYASNYLVRMDTDLSILNYPQNPLVRSSTYAMGNLDNHPAGQNVVIALMSYEGYNMSDSIVLNKGSVQRGLARSTYYRPHVVEELRYSGGLVDEIGVPDKEVRGYKSEHDYRLLEDDGIIYPEAEVKEEDVLIGKTSPPRFLGEMDEFSVAANKRRESSVTVRHGEKGVVDMVAVTENEEGNRLIQ
ncbi:MAG: DNA-directed RNA polymerase subunit B, partial [Nanoarchaeota archaeon]